MNLAGQMREEWKGRNDRAQRRRIPGGSWRRGAAILVILATLGGTPSASTQTGPTGEYQIKAAFLFHFAQYIDWPEETFKTAGSPLTYCTVGDDPFQGALDASLMGKTIGARPIRVSHFKQPHEIQGCQIVFIGAAEQKLLPAVLASLRGNSVLTVGESEHFVQTGGMIGFLLEENKIRFEVNLDTAEHAKLKISSRLLALAKTVLGSHRGN